MKSYQQIVRDGTTDRATPAPASRAHTATPWAFVSPHPGQFAIVPENRQKHATTHTLAYIRDFQSNDEANAARICAAVNACAGMTDPEAEIKALRDALENFCRQVEFTKYDFPPEILPEHKGSAIHVAREAARAALKGATK